MFQKKRIIKCICFLIIKRIKTVAKWFRRIVYQQGIWWCVNPALGGGGGEVPGSPATKKRTGCEWKRKTEHHNVSSSVVQKTSSNMPLPRPSLDHFWVAVPLNPQQWNLLEAQFFFYFISGLEVNHMLFIMVDGCRNKGVFYHWATLSTAKNTW